MKKYLSIILTITGFVSFAQEINLGGSASLWVGNQASFYFGGNTTLNGTVTNNGEIISYSDLDFVANRAVGNLKFVGAGDQNLSGDTLDVSDIVVDKAGNSNVVLLTDRVIVTGMLDVTNGVIQADDELDLIVRGSSQNSGQGYVEGKLVGESTGQAITFPMGLGGSPNYLTLSGTDAGTFLRVEIAAPDPVSVTPDKEIKSVSTDVEWVITTIGEGSSTDGQLSIDFSGVDLSTINGEDILAEVFRPAIVALADGDSLYRVLATSSISNLDIDNPQSPPTSGTIIVEELVNLSERPVKLAIAWIPIVNDIEFFVPNSFAPGSTFIENQIFRPFFSGDEITSISFTVFNSLNTEVYSVAQSGTDIDLSLLGWDGVLPSGQPAPAGVYYYNVVLTSTTDRRSKAGAVLLVK